MISYDVSDIIWYDFKWYHIIWFDAVWYHFKCFDIIIVRYDMIWYDMIWYQCLVIFMTWHDWWLITYHLSIIMINQSDLTLFCHYHHHYYQYQTIVISWSLWRNNMSLVYGMIQYRYRYDWFYDGDLWKCCVSLQNLSHILRTYQRCVNKKRYAIVVRYIMYINTVRTCWLYTSSTDTFTMIYCSIYDT